MAVFKIKQGDTSPDILYALTPTDVVLTGSTVIFRYRPLGSTTWASKSATVHIEDTTPTVKYAWQEEDTASAGLFEAEFVVTYSDSSTETFPNDGYITLDIEGDASGVTDLIRKVRFLIGDLDSDDYEVSDENVVFSLEESGNDVYLAASICARAISSKYIGFGKVTFDGVSTDKSEVYKAFNELARRLEKQSKKYGSSSLGLPIAGGISISDIDSVNENTDRPRPAFNVGQFRNPPGYIDSTVWGWQ